MFTWNVYQVFPPGFFPLLYGVLKNVSKLLESVESFSSIDNKHPAYTASSWQITSCAKRQWWAVRVCPRSLICGLGRLTSKRWTLVLLGKTCKVINFYNHDRNCFIIITVFSISSLSVWCSWGRLGWGFVVFCIGIWFIIYKEMSRWWPGDWPRVNPQVCRGSMMRQKKGFILFHDCPGWSVAIQFSHAAHGPNDVSNNNKRITLCMWVIMLYQQRVLRHNNMKKNK